MVASCDPKIGRKWTCRENGAVDGSHGPSLAIAIGTRIPIKCRADHLEESLNTWRPLLWGNKEAISATWEDSTALICGGKSTGEEKHLFGKYLFCQLVWTGTWWAGESRSRRAKGQRDLLTNGLPYFPLPSPSPPFSCFLSFFDPQRYIQIVFK